MAEAEGSGGGGSGIDGWFIFLVIIVLLVLWLREGGLQALRDHPINFGWQPAASSTSPFPFVPNFDQFAPHVAYPNAPQGPQGPRGPSGPQY